MPQKFKLEINLTEGGLQNPQVFARLLHKIAREFDIEMHHMEVTNESIIVIDLNGKQVGAWTFD